MKIRSTFHVLALLMAALTFSMPFAQHTSVRAAQTQPIVQINKGLGMDTGCLIPGISTASTSSVPRILFAQQLLGKSPEYVANYAQNPQAASKKSSTQTAILGCVVIGVGAVVALGFMIWVLDGIPTM